jgi:RND family efflux transporter MFP subunit
MMDGAVSASQVSERSAIAVAGRSLWQRCFGCRLLSVGCMALILAWGVVTFSQTREASRTTALPARPEPPVLTVTVAPVTMQAGARSVDGDGSVVAWQELVVGAEVAGLRAIEIAVDEGDRVRRGQMLVRFDESVLAAQATQAEANLAEADAALRNARAELNRAAELSHGAFIAPQALEQRQFAARQADARWLSARAHRDEAAARLMQARLLAPADGIVARRSVQLGAVSMMGQEMFRLIRDGRLELDVKVPELELAALRPGQAAHIWHGDSEVEATVRAIAPTVTTDTRLGVVHIALPAASDLRPGMFARAEILVDDAPMVAVPEAALTFQGNEPAAFVLQENGLVAQRRLITGERRNGLVEVTKGLQVGESIVTSGAGFLTDGDRVRVVPALAVAAR